MTYIISTNTPSDEATFRQVSDLTGYNAEGLIAMYAGASGEGLSITAIWETKAHADRFTAEKLIPALQQVGVGGGASTIIEFEAFAEPALAESSAS